MTSKIGFLRSVVHYQCRCEYLVCGCLKDWPVTFVYFHSLPSVQCQCFRGLLPILAVLRAHWFKLGCSVSVLLSSTQVMVWQSLNIDRSLRAFMAASARCLCSRSMAGSEAHDLQVDMAALIWDLVLPF